MKIKEIPMLKHNINSETLAGNDLMKKSLGRIARIAIISLRFFLLFGLSFIILYPLVYMISISFRQPLELLDPTVVWIPKTFTLDNMKTVYTMLDYPVGLMRTTIMSLLCAVLQCFSCSLAGYGFARFRFRGRNILFFAALFTLIVPPQAVMMPTYISYINFTEFSKILIPNGFQLIDTMWPLALPAFFGSGIRAGLFIYIYRQFFKNMPLEIEDAAYIDGCGPVKAYWKVMFANTGPVLLVSFLFSIVWYWNDYFAVSLYFTNARPLSVLVASFRDYLNSARNPDGSPYSGPQMIIYLQVACLMFITPVLAMYVFLQKYFTQSIVRAGIVG